MSADSFSFASHPLVEEVADVEYAWSIDREQARSRANLIVCRLIAMGHIPNGVVYHGSAIALADYRPVDRPDPEENLAAEHAPSSIWASSNGTS